VPEDTEGSAGELAEPSKGLSAGRRPLWYDRSISRSLLVCSAQVETPEDTNASRKTAARRSARVMLMCLTGYLHAGTVSGAAIPRADP
jgi:hypothetical protein